MGQACGNCTSKDEESQFEMNGYQETGTFGHSTQGNNENSNAPQRVAI